MKEYFDNLFKDIDNNIYLDLEQRMVILDDSRFLMVIAGAGSGKTTTMSAKVKYLVDIKKIDPKKIIIISFTNKAVNELKDRINKQFKINCRICTFHSLAFSILKDNGYNFKINNFPHKIVENFLKKHKKDKKILKNSSYAVEIINLYKNNPIVFHNKKKNQVFQKLYDYYENYMQINNLIDFEDMINKSCKLFEKSKIEINYDYIIIDEFQDISLNRYNLVLQIIKVSKCKVIVVGDDWQTIFSFAGSNINLFHEFAKKAKILKINNTHRNSQELIDIAGNFIMRNNNQIAKKLKSNKHINNVVNIVGFLNEIKALCVILDKLVNDFGLNQKVLLLGRYTFDINKYLKKNIIEKNTSKIVYLKYPNLDITFLTVHSAKGLGYDNVIILNGNKGLYGFPSLKENDEIKKELINNSEKYLYAEERRLFYVALTRTKNKVYVCYKLGNRSIFVKELLKYKEINNKIVL